MLTFIIRRLILSIIVLFLVTILSFLLLRLTPGDPASIMLGENATPEQLADLRSELLLDRPLIVQYSHWFYKAIRGEFGKSLVYNENVSSLIATRLPITLSLSIIAFFLSTIIGVSAGIICAIRRGAISDLFITLSANIGVAVPIFWLGILGIYFFGLKLGWLPIQGYTSPFDDLGLSIKKGIMPIICMAIPALMVMTRQTRSSMLEVIRQDYIRTAWSKGLKERIIMMEHALRNAFIPIVTLLGLQLRTVVGGSVLVETVFNIPGMGRLLVLSVFSKDFIVVQAGTMIIALVVLLGNLLVDISYGWLDPRVRYD